MDATALIIAVVAMVLVFKVFQMRMAYRHRELEARMRGAPETEQRLSRLEERLSTLESLLIEEEKRRAGEEKWKALEK